MAGPGRKERANIRKRRTKKRSDEVRWCIDNKENLKFQSFADHFDLTDKQHAYNLFTNIITNHLNDNDILIKNFNTWKHSNLAEEYWMNKTHRTTVTRSKRYADKHIQKTVKNEYVNLDRQAFNELCGLKDEKTCSSPSTSSGYSESQKGIYYQLTFDELNDDSIQASKTKYRLTAAQQAFNRRLSLSSVSTTSEPSYTLRKHNLNGESFLMVRRFKTAVRQSQNSFTATDLLQSVKNYNNTVFCLLIYTLNIISIDKKQQQQQQQQQIRKSETDFITKYVTNFFQNIAFIYGDKITIRWDTASYVYDSAVRKKRPDYIISTIDGCEVGCGEIKPPNRPTSLIKEDRCRVPEHLKRQLHKRLQAATSEKELVTFGFFGVGEELDLSVMQFIDGRYQYSVIKQLKLPTMTTTYEHMDESLEFLIVWMTF